MRTVATLAALGALLALLVWPRKGASASVAVGDGTVGGKKAAGAAAGDLLAALQRAAAAGHSEASTIVGDASGLTALQQAAVEAINTAFQTGRSKPGSTMRIGPPGEGVQFNDATKQWSYY